MSTTETATHFVVTIPKAKDELGIDRPSIRQICLEGLFLGRSKADISAAILQHHPGSAPTTSAKKMAKHIGWYKSRMKTVGTPEYKWVQAQLAQMDAPDVLPPVEAPVVEAEAEGMSEADRLAAEIDARLAQQDEAAA